MFLIIITLIGLSNSWQNNLIGYTFGFRGQTPLTKGNPVFEIVSQFPSLEKYFGLVGGMAYLFPLAIFSIFAGV